jgi:hypothetical protein
LALERKNDVFVGSACDGERAAAMCTICVDKESIDRVADHYCAAAAKGDIKVAVGIEPGQVAEDRLSIFNHAAYYDLSVRLHKDGSREVFRLVAEEPNFGAIDEVMAGGSRRFEFCSEKMAPPQGKGHVCDFRADGLIRQIPLKNDAISPIRARRFYRDNVPVRFNQQGAD